MIVIGIFLNLIIGTPTITWFQNISDFVWTSPAVGDIDNDGLSEIVVCAGSDGGWVNQAFCFETDGILKWSVAGDEYGVGPILANIDNSGDAEVMFKTNNGLKCYSANGTLLWTHTPTSRHIRTFAVANVDTSGDAEIVYTNSTTLYCVNSGGGTKWLVPTTGEGNISIADVDKDSIPEILVYYNGTLHCHSGIDGRLEWTANTPIPGSSAPAVADVDRDSLPEIIVTTTDWTSTNRVYCIEGNGTIKWEYIVPITPIFNKWQISKSAIADIDCDGRYEIVFFVMRNQRIHVIRENAAGNGADEVWTADAEDICGGSGPTPIICNIDADPQLEVIWIGSKALKIYDGITGAVDYSDSVNFYSGTQDEHGASAADVDNDGVVEIVGIYKDGGIALLEDDANWATLHKSAFQSDVYHITDIEQPSLYVPKYPPWHWLDHNTWLTQLDIQPEGVEEIPADANFNLRIYPNPFVQSTVIRYRVSNVNETSIKIYDLSGRAVKTFNNLTNQPFNQIAWNGEDENGKKVKKGIYFCRLEAANLSPQIKKIVYLH